MRTLGKIQEKNIKKKKLAKKQKKKETNFGKNRKIWKKLGKRKSSIQSFSIRLQVSYYPIMWKSRKIHLAQICADRACLSRARRASTRAGAPAQTGLARRKFRNLGLSRRGAAPGTTCYDTIRLLFCFNKIYS